MRTLTVDVVTKDGLKSVPAALVLPTFAVTAHLRLNGEFSDYWCITHIATGRRYPPRLYTKHNARRLCLAMERVAPGIVVTVPGGKLHDHPVETQRAAKRIQAEVDKVPCEDRW